MKRARNVSVLVAGLSVLFFLGCISPITVNTTTSTSTSTSSTTSSPTSSTSSTSTTTTTTVQSFDVVYVGNGNAGGTVPETVTQNSNSTVVVSANTGSLTKTGYNFAGWTTCSSATITGSSYAGGASFTVNSSVVLYAIWMPENLLFDSTQNSVSIIGNTVLPHGSFEHTYWRHRHQTTSISRFREPNGVWQSLQVSLRVAGTHLGVAQA